LRAGCGALIICGSGGGGPSSSAGDDWRERAAKELPMGKLAQVDEIADFVVFLLSDRSGVVTGSVIDWDQKVQGAFD
jgi:NAD(P)-dependent dehydrogenase (short-subunit alcohol dehydrogenase family)